MVQTKWTTIECKKDANVESLQKSVLCQLHDLPNIVVDTTVTELLDVVKNLDRPTTRFPSTH